ncbi:MAG: hypothetical protein C4323_23150 [Mastigocladus sp. ERB_26_2]
MNTLPTLHVVVVLTSMFPGARFEFREEPGLLLATLLMRAIKVALLPPLRNPVAIAIAIIFQEERSRKEIKCMILVYKPI